MAVVLLTLILGALVLLYLHLTRKNSYWQKRKVPCADGALPGFGHMLPLLSLRATRVDYFDKLYNDNKARSMVGFYNCTSPSLMVLEPELVKTVLQTNFTSFHQNGVQIDPDLDPLLANNPFFNYGEKWTTARKRLTYAFSSMRLKILLENVKLVCGMLQDFLDKKLSKVDAAEVELKDIFSRYTAQVVASAGFSVDGFCFTEKEDEMSFRNIGKAITKPSTRNKIMFPFLLILPSLNKLLKLSVLPKHVDRFFRELVTDIMEKRRTEEVRRNDFLQLMFDLERTEGDKFDTEILTSHAMSFVTDGYETSSSVLSFVGFQLTTHPEVQQKLREEVMSVLAKYDGAITYDGLREMTYMDQVISESQRAMTLIANLIKVCTDETELRGSDGLVCRVEPGTEIIIPICGLHKDPRYWQDPEVFDPERFSPERKNSNVKYTFLPFGEGPRMCVGMRMALLQIKACLATVLSRYRLELSPRTQLPLKMIPSSIFLLTPKGGLWAFVRRL